jgi:hypothetical protein
MRFGKQLFVAGAIAYAILCAFAVLFYKERMVMPDDANYVFELVTNGGHFGIFHHRFISVLTQWLPFAAIRLGADLGTVAWLYSLNLMLFYATCYLACGFIFHNYRAALAMLLFYLLITTHTFFWAVPETGMGIALLFVLFAMLSGEREARFNVPNICMAGVLIIFAVCAHGLIIFVISFMLVYLWLKQPERRRWIWTAAAWTLAVLVFKSIFLQDEYDRHALGGLRNFIRLFPDYFSTESMRHFLRYCTRAYAWIPVIFLINCFYYVAARHWLRLLLMTACCIGYLMLATIAFPDIQGNGFYNENLFLPLAVFLSIPLVYDVLPAIPRPSVSVLIVMLIVFTGLWRILDYRHFYHSRLAWQRGLIGKYRGRKVILDAHTFPKDTLLIAWSSPYEVWLLSTIEKHETASVLITDDPAGLAAVAGNDPHLFVPAFGRFTYPSLPARYFLFRDTTHTYEIVR